MTQTSYERLIARIRESGILGSVSELLEWDEEVTMPPQGIHVRALEKGVVAALQHRLATSDEVGVLLKQASQEVRTDEEKAMLREISWDYERARKVPENLVKELEEVSTLAVESWKEARRTADFSKFAPYLEKLVRLKKEYARSIDSKRGAYEVLVEDFESDLSIAEMKVHFAAIKKKLIPLIATAAKRKIDTTMLTKELPESTQEEFNKEILAYIGYDFTKGRLDPSTHPFTAAWGRITTRYAPDYTNAIGSTMHEAGHAFYEHGLPLHHLGTPLGSACSLSIHESQSRLWENHVGKSLAFWTGLFPRLQSSYGLHGLKLENFYRALNAIEPGFIRVDADEVTYTMHIILRFEIEMMLFDGTLAARDVPSVWNQKMKEYLGVSVPHDSVGCLQDIHWSSQLFGYFPTYSMGSMIAAQLFAAMKSSNPDIDADIEQGKFNRIHAWLRQHIHQHGRRFRTKELVRMATGNNPRPDEYIAYLETKFKQIYV